MAISSNTPLYIHSETIAASVIIAVAGVFGLVLNSTAILALRYNPALRNSFGLLCFSLSIANIGGLLLFVFWSTPVTLL
ncbi:hypothetical protein KIN20_024631 [Parelaphostrongylus tenuis]|uniref:7TM GPCR serpentine receptor class x (Srx) domain-containing protein n=1 Tax=Parelaphostrongylus tenuis TaxID=148309 RepID=A0AAD5QW32_PARTN|nr:hypothetical protein KIN20_024631 [Parelaphostrongylus tenuis]